MRTPASSVSTRPITMRSAATASTIDAVQDMVHLFAIRRGRCGILLCQSLSATSSHVPARRCAAPARQRLHGCAVELTVDRSRRRDRVSRFKHLRRIVQSQVVARALLDMVGLGGNRADDRRQSGGRAAHPAAPCGEMTSGSVFKQPCTALAGTFDGRPTLRTEASFMGRPAWNQVLRMASPDEAGCARYFATAVSRLKSNRSRPSVAPRLER